MEINFLNIALHIVNVIILYFILRWLLFKPVSKFMKNRENMYVDRAKAVEKRETEAKIQKEKYSVLLGNAQEEAVILLNKSTETAQKQSDEIIGRAQERSRDIIDRSMRQIEMEKQLAKQDLKDDVAEMAVQIAQKILQREISREDNQKVINDFFDKVG
jgi:F-type H+-transporting ATPase subunit b